LSLIIKSFSTTTEVEGFVEHSPSTENDLSLLVDN